MKHIMLDLETMGNGSTAAIVAIGACEFDPQDKARYDIEPLPGASIGSTLYYKVTLQSSVDAGLVIDPSTILWWMQQSDAARKSTFWGGDSVSLRDALIDFNAWVYHIAMSAGQTAPNRADVAIWGNGATFDNVIIRAAFKAVDLIPCWSFRNDKCYRTVSNLPGAEAVPFDRSGTAHNALDDAITQALHLQKVYKALGL